MCFSLNHNSICRYSIGASTITHQVVQLAYWAHIYHNKHLLDGWFQPDWRSIHPSLALSSASGQQSLIKSMSFNWFLSLWKKRGKKKKKLLTQLHLEIPRARMNKRIESTIINSAANLMWFIWFWFIFKWERNGWKAKNICLNIRHSDEWDKDSHFFLYISFVLRKWNRG